MPTGSEIRFHPFTLIELVVVIVVITLVSSIAITRFGGESPSRLLESTLTDFEGFCGRVRYRAVEDGLDWEVRFDPETRRFTAFRQARREAKVYRSSEDANAVDTEVDPELAEAAAPPRDEDGEEPSRNSSFSSEAAAKLIWSLPEKITFTIPDEEEREIPEEDEIGGGFEVFRFFPDGSCGGDTLLVFYSGETLAKTVSISKLTGRMITKEGDATLPLAEESETGTTARQKAVYGEKI